MVRRSEYAPGRRDHFTYSNGVPTVTPTPEETPEGFSPAQLEYLERKFGPEAQLAVVMRPGTQEDIMHNRGIAAGFATVLAHIATLSKVSI